VNGQAVDARFSLRAGALVRHAASAELRERRCNR
jgi:hypothetical protein